MQLEIIKLSDEKVCVHNTIEIKCGDNHIGYYDISTSYRLEYAQLKMIYTDRFIIKLSNIYGIKKKFIGMILKSIDTIVIDNINYPNTKIIYQVEFTDNNWYIKYNRDLKIKQLLNR